MLVDEYDLLITEDIDLSLDSYDLETVHDLENKIQQLRLRLSHKPGDWPTNPYLGIGLDLFRGQHNTEETGKKIRNTIYNNIMSNHLIDPLLLYLDVYPISKIGVKVEIGVKINNSLRILKQFTLNFTNGTIEFTKHNKSLNEVQPKKFVNKYLKSNF